jgi:hypothetical protein
MFGSVVVYSGLVMSFAGLILTAKPIARVGVGTRARALVIACAGLALTAVGLVAPAFESRTMVARTRLDEFAPAWQFHEVHQIRIAAKPERVFDAIKRVRADEIVLFHTLTWIRRGGRPAPESILNAGASRSLIDVATESGFVRLADDAPTELVVGAVVAAPRGARGPVTARVFQTPLPPGFALATMNFLVTPDGPNASTVTTETRVFANSPSARRRFAAYWRVIYPGSAIIRRMWLRAIARRALQPANPL